MNLSDLTPHPGNPRKISDQKLEMLKKSLDQFGDLSGIVFNRRSSRLVGGHQRLKVLPKDLPIKITKTYKEPTRTGSVADGYVELDGERYRYREVDWDDPTEKAANIAANQHGGEWEIPALNDWLNELDALNIPMDVVGFTEREFENLMAPTGVPSSGGSGKKEIECPHCGKTFDQGTTP